MLYYRSVERSYINIHYFYFRYCLSPVEANSILSKYKVDSFKNRTWLMVHFKDFSTAYEKWWRMKYKRRIKERPIYKPVDENKCYYLKMYSNDSFIRIAFVWLRKFYFEDSLSTSAWWWHITNLFKKSDIINYLKGKKIKYNLKFEWVNVWKNFSKRECDIINYFSFLYDKKFRDKNSKFDKICDYLWEEWIKYDHITWIRWDS